jgi:DNA-binding beta-propeller fold protein YncE
MRAPRRAPKGGAFACRLVLATALGGAVPACGLNQEGVPPPRDHISFPGSALVDPGNDWLYVINSNSDLRYNNGTLVSVNLKAAAVDRAGQWELCPAADYIRPTNDQSPSCCWDFLDHSILNCDERNYVAPDSTIEIGSFASAMVFQPFDEIQDANHCGNPAYPNKVNPGASRHQCTADCAADRHGTGRLYMGVRGNSTLTYADLDYDVDGAGNRLPHFSCMKPPAEGQACTVTQTLGSTNGDMAIEPIAVPDEPYTLALDRDRDFLYVGHLKGDISHADTGGVSLFDVHNAKDGVDPTFIGPSQAFFPPDINGLFGVTSLTLHNGSVYATSRYGNSATNLVTTTPADTSCAAVTTPDNSFMVLPGSDTFVTPLVGVEIRGIQFPPDMNRAFLLQRVPPAVVGFDIANGAGGLFGNVPSDVVEMCQAPTFLQQAGEGADARLYITCFESGQVYVVDPFVPRLTNVIEVGRGPAGLAFAPPGPDGERLAYVVGFSANNISVVDLTPGSPTEFHVIQRIGFPSTVPRQ